MSLRVLGGIGGTAWQLKPYRAAWSTSVGGRFNRTPYCVVPSPGERGGEPKMEQDKEKRPLAQHRKKTLADVMKHSFGDGYSTRSEEEGFGGVYGRDDSDEDRQDDNPEYDKSQGCEVKEKEKARHQPHHH